MLADDSGDAAFFCAQNHREECCNNFQKLICNQHAEFKDAIAYQHVTIVEAHAGWCGPTDCVNARCAAHRMRPEMDHNDDNVTNNDENVGECEALTHCCCTRAKAGT